MPTETITQLLQEAIASREHILDVDHATAFRLLNGFTEGNPHLSLDLYAGSVIFHNYHSDESEGMALVHEALEFVQHHPRLAGWLHAGIVKSRNSTIQA